MDKSYPRSGKVQRYPGNLWISGMWEEKELEKNLQVLVSQFSATCVWGGFCGLSQCKLHTDK